MCDNHNLDLGDIMFGASLNLIGDSKTKLVEESIKYLKMALVGEATVDAKIWEKMNGRLSMCSPKFVDQFLKV